MKREPPVPAGYPGKENPTLEKGQSLNENLRREKKVKR